MRYALIASLVSCAAVQRSEPNLIACGKAELQSAIADVAPTVGAILDAQTGGWQKQLEVLGLGLGVEAVTCAVSAFTEAAPVITAPDAIRPIVIKTPKRTANAHLYLNIRKP